jgi:hypothetical protein
VAEAAARERTEREEEEAEHPACHVPALKGDTLAAARHALAKAHCRLGAIHRPTHHHGTLYVSLNLTGMEPGAYRFDVYASNTAG